jgi:hypothetical protein
MKLKLTPLVIMGAIGAFASGPADAATATIVDSTTGTTSGTLTSVSVDASGNVMVNFTSSGGGGGPNPVTGCTITPDAPVITAGNSVTLTANCPYATSFAWTKDGNTTCGSGSSCSTGALAQGTYVFGVTGSNSVPSSAQDTDTVTVNAAPPPPPPGNYTIDSAYDAKFDSPGSVYYPTVLSGTPTAFQFDNNTGIVFGRIWFTNANQGQMDVVISATPGDFDNASVYCKKLATNGSTIYYKNSQVNGYCYIPANTTMYLNMRVIGSSNASVQTINYKMQ